MHLATTLAALVACSTACLAGQVRAASTGPTELAVGQAALLPEGFRFPESIAWDARTRHLYVGSFDNGAPPSARNNQLLRLDEHGAVKASRSVATAPLTGIAVHQGSVYVLDFEAAALRRLPALFDASTPVETVATVPRLATPAPGTREVANPDGSHDMLAFGSAGIPAVNGLVFDHRGDAYISDSFQGAIFVVRKAARCRDCVAELVLQHPLLATAAALPFGANGLAFDDRGTLFVNNAGDGRVLRVDLDTASIEVFAERIHGADGLLYHDGLLWVCANQADAVVALDREGRIVAQASGFRGINRDGAPDGLLFPAASVVVDGRMLVVNLSLPLTARVGDEWEESVTRWSIAAFDLPRPDSTAATSLTQFVILDDARIAYRRIGSGPAIILVNRLRGTLDTWDPAFLDALAARHTVITVDYPGIGYSSGTQIDDISQAALFVDAFARALQLERFAILGWSWGGLVAQAMVTDLPGRITHGVFLATNPPGKNEVPLQPVFLERAIKPVNDLDDEEILFFEPHLADSVRAARQSRQRIHARPGVDERIPSSPAQFQAYIRAAEGFHVDAAGRRKALESVQIPLLVIAGDNDPSTAGQNWFPLIGALRSTRFVFVGGAGHAPQHQHPQTTATLIADFLATSHLPDPP